jgi:serine/threonine protein kinase
MTEYAFMGKASQKSDVFSFGIMMLEVFTGKRPTDLMFVDGLSLRKWVSQALPARLVDIVDTKLLQDEEIHHICLDHKADDTALGSYSTSTSNSILASAFELGIMCSSESAGQRMAMKDVVTKLQDIKKDYSASVQAIQRPQRS